MGGRICVGIYIGICTCIGPYLYLYLYQSVFVFVLVSVWVSGLKLVLVLAWVGGLVTEGLIVDTWEKGRQAFEITCTQAETCIASSPVTS